MKKIMIVILTVGILWCLFSGCGTNRSETGVVVSTEGSTSMEKVMGYLSESYCEKADGVKVTYSPTGSGSGIQAVAEGRCDIGLSSRELKEEESDNLDGHVVAIDAIAIIVNCENTIEELSMEQIEALYSGKITNWKDVGGDDAPVVLVGREAASGTRDGFEAITNTAGRCRYSYELTSSGDVVQTIASNPNAIGYASLATVKENVKTLKVDNIAPSKESVQNGEYKIQRNFLFVTRKGESLSDEAQKFIDYAMCGDADELIEKAGAIAPVR